jgi:hypothetical protein
MMERMYRDIQDAWLTEKQDGIQETTACQEGTETSPENLKACHEATKAETERTEPDPGMMQSVGEHEEVPKEEATVTPVGRFRKRRRDRNLAARPARSRRGGSRQVLFRGRDLPSPAGRHPTVPEWHGAKGKR